MRIGKGSTRALGVRGNGHRQLQTAVHAGIMVGPQALADFHLPGGGGGAAGAASISEGGVWSLSVADGAWRN